MEVFKQGCVTLVSPNRAGLVVTLLNNASRSVGTMEIFGLLLASDRSDALKTLLWAAESGSSPARAGIPKLAGSLPKLGRLGTTIWVAPAAVNLWMAVDKFPTVTAGLVCLPPR